MYNREFTPERITELNPNVVTRIGCGIAGFKDEEIAPLFNDAIDVENVILPKDFVEVMPVSFGTKC